MQGKIKKIIRMRGFGFIEADDYEGDIFFHRSQLQGIFFEDLREGLPVEFELEETPKGTQAVNIAKGSEAEAEAEAEAEEEAEPEEEAEAE